MENIEAVRLCSMALCQGLYGTNCLCVKKMPGWKFSLKFKLKVESRDGGILTDPNEVEFMHLYHLFEFLFIIQIIVNSFRISSKTR